MRNVLKALLVFIALAAVPALASAGLDASPEALVTGPAQAAPPAAPSEAGLLVDIVTSAHQGNWKLAMAGLLTLLMLVVRKLNLHSAVPFFRSDRGGSILVMLLAVCGALASALSTPGMHITLQTFVAAISVGLTSVGGYHWIGNMVNPADKAKPSA